MSIGARLKEMRIKKGQSLQDVADAVGSSKAHIWEIERGGVKNPSVDLVKKLAAHFEIATASLVGEDPLSEESEEMIVLYRDLKDLSEQDRKAVRSLIKHYRDKRDA